MEREDRTGRKHRRVGWTLLWGLTVVAGFLFGVYHGERKSSTALFGRGGFSGKVDAHPKMYKLNIQSFPIL